MPTFDRFDICEAYYLYATFWHEGQGSWSYRIFGRLEKIKFHTGKLREQDLTENGRMIYDRLVEKRTLTAVNE